MSTKEQFLMMPRNGQRELAVNTRLLQQAWESIKLQYDHDLNAQYFIYSFSRCLAEGADITVCSKSLKMRGCGDSAV